MHIRDCRFDDAEREARCECTQGRSKADGERSDESLQPEQRSILLYGDLVFADLVPAMDCCGGVFPAGFDPKPAPFGVSFTGTACSEPKLIELAYAFEQATKKRRAPPLFP